MLLQRRQNLSKKEEPKEKQKEKEKEIVKEEETDKAPAAKVEPEPGKQKEPVIVEKVTSDPVVEELIAEDIIEEIVIPEPEEDVVALYKTDFKKLTGPRVVGRIDLPVEEKKKSTPFQPVRVEAAILISEERKEEREFLRKRRTPRL